MCFEVSLPEIQIVDFSGVFVLLNLKSFFVFFCFVLNLVCVLSVPVVQCLSTVKHLKQIDVSVWTETTEIKETARAKWSVFLAAPTVPKNWQAVNYFTLSIFYKTRVKNNLLLRLQKHGACVFEIPSMWNAQAKQHARTFTFAIIIVTFQIWCFYNHWRA